MLPSELNNITPSLGKQIWPMKLLKEGLGARNETEVREWFHQNPAILTEFEIANREIMAQIQYLQSKAKHALQNCIVMNFTPEAPPIQSAMEKPIIPTKRIRDF